VGREAVEALGRQFLDPGLSGTLRLVRPDAAVYRIPLSRDKWFLFRGDFPVTQAEWDHMLAALELFRPGLVAGPPQPVPTAVEDAGEAP